MSDLPNRPHKRRELQKWLKIMTKIYKIPQIDRTVIWGLHQMFEQY